MTIAVRLETPRARGGIGVGRVELSAERGMCWSWLIKEGDSVRLGGASDNTDDSPEPSVVVGGVVPAVGAYRE